MAATHEFVGDRSGPAWLKRKRGDRVDIIDQEGGVAQVDPLRLCRFLLQQCIARGVHLLQPAQAQQISCNEVGEISSIRIQHGDGTTLDIPCSRILVSSGAWTPQVFRTLFPTSTTTIPVSQLAGHSLVVRSPRWTREHETDGCHAIFTTVRSGFCPEIFSRIGGEIYIAGLNDPRLPLPRATTDAKIDPRSIAELTRVAERFLGRDGTDVSDLEILREGLCFRPVTRRGVPSLARIPDRLLGEGVRTQPLGQGGVFVAAGHGPWGISHSLGTGKVMAEMLEGREPSADLRDLGL